MAEGLTSPASKDSPLWWFPLNINDWSGDQKILFMKDHQVGWYIWLLVECWRTGGYLPNDPVKLAKFARAKSPKVFEREMAAVMGGFELTPDEQHIVHTRMADAWQEKQRLVQSKKRAAKSGVSRRQHQPGREAA